MSVNVNAKISRKTWNQRSAKINDLLAEYDECKKLINVLTRQEPSYAISVKALGMYVSISEATKETFRIGCIDRAVAIENILLTTYGVEV